MTIDQLSDGMKLRATSTGAHLLPDRGCRGHRDRDDHELGEFADE
jgi:hypothetical protein